MKTTNNTIMKKITNKHLYRAIILLIGLTLIFLVFSCGEPMWNDKERMQLLKDHRSAIIYDYSLLASTEYYNMDCELRKKMVIKTLIDARHVQLMRYESCSSCANNDIAIMTDLHSELRLLETCDDKTAIRFIKE